MCIIYYIIKILCYIYNNKLCVFNLCVCDSCAFFIAAVVVGFACLSYKERKNRGIEVS